MAQETSNVNSDNIKWFGLKFVVLIRCDWNVSSSILLLNMLKWVNFCFRPYKILEFLRHPIILVEIQADWLILLDYIYRWFTCFHYYFFIRTYIVRVFELLIKVYSKEKNYLYIIFYYKKDTLCFRETLFEISKTKIAILKTSTTYNGMLNAVWSYIFHSDKGNSMGISFTAHTPHLFPCWTFRVKQQNLISTWRPTT